MPQIQFPFFPTGFTAINNLLAFSNKDGEISYFSGNLKLYCHASDDRSAFLLVIAQIFVHGTATQMELASAFGIPAITIKRAVKRFREKGMQGFYEPRNHRGPVVLTPQVCEQAQCLLDEGLKISEVAGRLAIKSDTLSKAVRAGRLRSPVRQQQDTVAGSSKSSRSERDSKAPMGMAATNVAGRIAASLGGANAVAPVFESSVLDVPNGGVLAALPALLATGLLESSETFFQLSEGYYGLESVLMLCAFMALTRVVSIEKLRESAPGEWGQLLGLDRIPEVRTIRNKLRELSENNQPEKWGAFLCERWMHAAPDQSLMLYIDGHVRVYHGSKTKLPRHYVTRQKLCLRATTDYWVNAMGGRPFFRVNQAVDPGMIQVIDQQILPQLEQVVPERPDWELLDAKTKAKQHRFTLVFDREGYSPRFFIRMKERKVACITYHKYPAEDWALSEFSTRQVKLHTGEVVSIQLAERGTRLSKKLWVREIRKLTDQGHQTSIISTDYCSDIQPLAAAMFARWSQENFFRYARQHYGIDRLADYSTEAIPDTVPVVNPIWRDYDSKFRSLNGQFARMMAKFGADSFKEPVEQEKMEAWVARKAKMQEEIEHMKAEVQAIKQKRKETPHHIKIGELTEEQRFLQLRTHSKHLVDTIKMIAYRAETAMADILREDVVMVRPNEARKLLQTLYTTEADLIPDHEAKTLTVCLHHMANRSTDVLIQKLFDELNATETIFPKTNLRLILKLGSIQNP